MVTRMRRYIGGDDAVFSAMYRALATKVRRQIRAVLGSDAMLDDLVQDTFLRAHAARERFVPEKLTGTDAVVSWYCAIARNAAVSELRRRYGAAGITRGAAVLVSDQQACDQPNAECATLAAERRRWASKVVHTSLAALPESQRRVVEMHKLHDLPMCEVARRLGIRPGAARVRAHRAYRTMALRVQSLPGDDG